jgi:hypothetical protein
LEAISGTPTATAFRLKAIEPLSFLKKTVEGT